MSGAHANRRNPPASVDEWRVGSDGPSKPGAEPPETEGQWTQADASLRCARVSADLESWRELLDDRMRRLEERLSRAGDSRE
jgi:hypothetical protein